MNKQPLNTQHATIRHRIPYFEPIMQGLLDQDENTQAAFGKHVHWGYWPDPTQANGSAKKFGEAAEALCEIHCDHAGIESGMRVLDVGCGFGGTIASLNDRFSRMEMCGVNIDSRQLERARQRVRPQNENSIEFLETNANCIPLPDASFDVVLAVESIFHFDRQRFFLEAKRLLKQGGTFVFSDFLISEQALRYIGSFDLFGNQEIFQSYGEVDLTFSIERYRALADEHGLAFGEAIDITENTMPTYDFLLSTSNGMPTSWQEPSFVTATQMLKKASQRKLMSYQILKFTNRPGEGRGDCP